MKVLLGVTGGIAVFRACDVALLMDRAGHYLVMVPQLKTASQGHSWGDNAPPGAPLSIDRFYLANDVVSAVDQPEGTRDGVGGDLAQNRDLIRRSSHLASHPEFVTMPR